MGEGVGEGYRRAYVIVVGAIHPSNSLRTIDVHADKRHDNNSAKGDGRVVRAERGARLGI
jgi:hypothetical protein